MTEWRVIPEVQRFMLQSTLHELTSLGFDIHELTYIQPIHAVRGAATIYEYHSTARIGDFYCIVAVKY